MQTEADCFSPEAQKLAEARLAAKRAARAEAREIRMKELERQQKEIYQVQKKYYGLDTKWGDIEQWMEDSERYSRRSRRNASASDEDERMSVGSRGSLRSDLEYASAYPVAGLENERTKKKNSKATNGYDEDMYGSSQSRKSSRSSNYSGESRKSTKKSSREEKSPSLLYSDVLPARSYRASLYDESIYSGNRRYSASSSRAPSEYSCYLGSGSRASSRASSARASPVVEERPEKDFEKGARTVSSLSAATLASLGGTSSRRGSGDTSISVDTEASIREIKDSLAEVEEKYKKAMVSNAQLDNEKTNFMYQVDTLKDALLELEEQLAESRRQYEEKSKEFEREKHAHSILQFQFTEIKETLKQREEMLEEIRQLQQKQESYIREISDLQETIEWKDKKIGALERQKEFFDSIRSERDDLRDEVVVLKEQLKKHGIIPNLEVATNGEALDGLDNEAHSDSTKITPGATQTLQTAGDGTLGRANEVEMKDEILEDVGKREILQNTEHEEHKEESEEREIVKECTERKTLHADENTEAEKTMEDNDVTSTVMLSSGCEEQIQSHTEHVSGNVSSTENSDVIELRKETESGDDSIEAQQLGSKESEHSDLNHLTNENWETGTLQSQGIETPLGIPTDIDTEHESERVAQEQKVKQEDFTICQREDSIEIFQEALDFVVSSHASASEQSGSPEGARAGTGNEESHVEAHTESLCQAEESTENEVMSSLEKQLDEDEGCIDRTISKVGSGKNESDTAKEENKTGNTVPSQGRKEVDSVEEEGEATCESEVTPDTIVNEQKPDETHTLSTFSKSDLILAEEEGNMQDEAENEKDIAGKGQTKDIGKMEELTGMLDVQPDSENKRVEEEEPVASLDEFAEIKEGVSHQTGQDQDVMKESQSQETILVPCPSDHEIEESNTEMWDESRKGKESRGELMEDERTQVETQTIKCSEEIKNNPIQEKEKTVENEMQKVVKQEEDESRQELTQDVSVIIEENVDDKEASVESSEKLDLPDQQHDRFVSDDSSLQKITKLSQQLSESLEGNTKEMEVQNAVLDDACQLSRKEGDTKQMGNGNEEDENKGIEEQHELQEVKKQEVVPDIEEDADYLKTQKAELDEKPDEQVEVEGQEEEIVEDDGKKIDFDDELGQILKAPGKHDAEEVTTQTLEEVREKEIVTETAKTEKGEKEETHQSRTQSVENEGMITEGNASIQQEKGKGTEEAGHLQTDASQSAAPEKACDLVEDETGNEKVLDSNDMEKIADGYSSEQELGNVGNTRDESKEDMQASRRGKGRSKEDCMIS
ncbi:leucine-rich repeat flightless-interacting protein 1 isoform X6 [Trachemys scripta elegans]|uniref:leucine-rich repeat flightless-interacting protein 1 isoform X6 n=1 Tax=Trachemys scripta elegans TaxID=31138 RepID=UPI0015527BFF|nr:leucine-rich repeat flightless-interacting protein 1 isoform X6 [Trachemys scripta elegans]